MDFLFLASLTPFALSSGILITLMQDAVFLKPVTGNAFKLTIPKRIPGILQSQSLNLRFERAEGTGTVDGIEKFIGMLFLCECKLAQDFPFVNVTSSGQLDVVFRG